jgi:hypothetical protein
MFLNTEQNIVHFRNVILNLLSDIAVLSHRKHSCKDMIGSVI